MMLGIIAFLEEIGIFDVVLPFFLIFVLVLWLFIAHFGKKNIDYKKGIKKYIALIVVFGLLNIFSDMLAGLFSFVFVIWIIVMYFKKKHLDLVHVYFFAILSYIIAFLIVALPQLVAVINEALANIVLLIAIAFIILGIFLTKRKKKKK